MVSDCYWQEHLESYYSVILSSFVLAKELSCTMYWQFSFYKPSLTFKSRGRKSLVFNLYEEVSVTLNLV